MNDTVKEQISALADGELPDGEVDLLLARMRKDPALRRTWDRYHLIGEALRNQLPAAVDIAGVADRVMTALDGEHLPPARKVPGRFLRPLASVAIAASVAVVAVLGVQRMQTSDTAPVVAARSAAPVAPVQRPAVAGFARVNETGAGTLTAAPPAARRPELLGRYVVNHNEHAASHGMQGMLSYVRIVGYDGDR
jgi:sigma-E factor negative regulatory protein RseA